MPKVTEAQYTPKPNAKTLKKAAMWADIKAAFEDDSSVKFEFSAEAGDFREGINTESKRASLAAQAKAAGLENVRFFVPIEDNTVIVLVAKDEDDDDDDDETPEEETKPVAKKAAAKK